MLQDLTSGGDHAKVSLTGTGGGRRRRRRRREQAVGDEKEARVRGEEE